jgi:hypothetical protein
MAFTRVQKPNPLAVLGINRELIVLLKGKGSLLRPIIQTNYRQLSKVHHPDNGGDPERFRLIQEAYDQLQDRNALVEAGRLLTAKQADASSQYHQALVDALQREGMWAEKLAQFMLMATDEPVNGRRLIHRYASARAEDEAFAKLGLERDRVGGLDFDVIIKDGIMTVDQVVAQPIPMGGPRRMEPGQPALYKGAWYERQTDPDRLDGDRIVYKSTGNVRKLVFLGTSDFSEPGDMFAKTESGIAAIEAGSSQSGDSFASDYPVHMVLPLLESLQYDLMATTYVGAYTDNQALKIMIVGSVVGVPGEKLPPVIPEPRG